ncbi:hypothetical protein I592_00438 [Enterococcus gilvus ATCC BAA-350]|uniref:Uncharacterized protein n=1 Tax=Enterococcus gilvus ATCC BAA-350 TaxID=1158614 RepID=R2XUC3_9ENTE|nr:hypothetical protein UKC_03524 [Enterococcus gilvus ATCC BAA-350]EOW81153.1 hypothetical protein I592_00438 [Enterococcus gilvus ATCC BAA-350]
MGRVLFGEKLFKGRDEEIDLIIGLRLKDDLDERETLQVFDDMLQVQIIGDRHEADTNFFICDERRKIAATDSSKAFWLRSRGRSPAKQAVCGD